MELRQLRQFIAVAEELSFSRAAMRLHMAQPPLSVAIRKLEDDLGAPLFDRRSRAVRLTPAGSEALRLARRCVGQADELLVAMRHQATGERGRIRLGFIGSATHTQLPRLLHLFSRRYPGIELDLRESATNAETLAMLESERLDAGLVRTPSTAPSGVSLEFLERDVFAAALPRTHPLARRRFVTLASLGSEPIINYTSTHVVGLHAMVMLAFQDAGISPRVVQHVTHVQTAMTLVEAGVGIALVPSRAASLVGAATVLRPIRGLAAGHAIGMALAYPAASETMAVERLRSVVAELFRKTGGAPYRHDAEGGPTARSRPSPAPGRSARSSSRAPPAAER
ncbi:MAG TPA: LysR substrate-binding domain-containing protein [Ramlibacter sp.]|uniref:LysR substrate-binding domain-containing protein n=1 Tax=Ramlibacter sp. TaxID=1917967 RepID=UPI002C2C3280|nr:LysR substrate-binding domain-containing protein [Ramlibacter sp.]HVZ43849.1 LysR substrate-binding domain-containing protein [Ramlibacter sp.]